MTDRVLSKFNRFYIYLGFLLIVLSFLVIFSLKTIFDSFAVSGEIDEKLLQTTTPRLDKESLNQAYEKFLSRKFIPLDL